MVHISVQPFSGIGTWVPNHFVLIKPNSTRQHFILDISDSMEFPPLSSETAEPTDERYLLTTTHQRQQHIQTNDVQTMRMMTWRLFLPHFRTRPNTVSQVNLWILTRLIGSYIRSWKRPGDLPRVIEILCLFASGAQRNERKDNNFYHEWKIARAFPTTHVSTYFFRKPITFTIANS